MNSESARLAFDPSSFDARHSGLEAFRLHGWAAVAARWVLSLSAAMALLFERDAIGQGPQPPDCKPPAAPVTGSSLGPSGNLPSGSHPVAGPQTGGPAGLDHKHGRASSRVQRWPRMLEREVRQNESTVTEDGNVRVRIGPVTWTTATNLKWPNAVTGIQDLVPGGTLPPFGPPWQPQPPPKGDPRRPGLEPYPPGIRQGFGPGSPCNGTNSNDQCFYQNSCPGCPNNFLWCDCSYVTTLTPEIGGPVVPGQSFLGATMASSGASHGLVSGSPGSGAFFVRYHAPTGPRLPFVDIRSVDGSIQRYEQYGHLWGSDHFRLVASIDSHDNATVYVYYPPGSPAHLVGKLDRVLYPSGIEEVWNYSPSWIGSPSTGCWDAAAFSGIEVTYKDLRAPSADLGGRTYGLLFRRVVVGPGYSRPFGGDKIYRVYQPKTRALPDLSQGDLTYQVPASHVLPERHSVMQVVYHDNSDVNEDDSLISRIEHLNLDSFFPEVQQPTVIPVIEYEYAVVGGVYRVKSEKFPLTGFGYTFDYPPSNVALPDGWIDNTLRTDSMGTVVATRLDQHYRVVETIVTPPSGATGRPRSVDPDNGGWSEPGSVHYRYEYGSCITCVGKPTVIEQVMVPSSLNRRTEFDYDPLTGLVVRQREMNPSGATGLVETSYHWEPMDAGSQFGAYRLASVADAAGQSWSYSYAVAPRPTPAGSVSWGSKIQRLTVTSPSVTLADGQSVAIAESEEYNVATPPTDSQGRQVGIVGQLIEAVSGDGVVMKLSYRPDGTIETETEGAGADEVVTTYEVDRWGTLRAITNQSTSSLPNRIDFDLDGSGLLVGMKSMVDGVMHESRFFHDRWGNLSVALRKNLSSSGGAPNDFGSPPRADAARTWLRDEWHYNGASLIASLRDRRALDRSAGSVAGDEEFVRENYLWSPDGNLLTHIHGNGSATDYTYDGFGTLYKAQRTGAGGQMILLGKSFVNAALETVREVRGGAGQQLVTIINRHPNGTVASIVEPTAVAPSGYQWPVASATHAYVWNLFGELTESTTSDGTSVLARTKFYYDALGRSWKVERFSGSSTTALMSGTTLWQGASKKLRETNSAGRIVQWSYDNLARLKEVSRSSATSAPANPDKVVYEYEPKSHFVRREKHRNWDEAGSPPAYVSRETEFLRDSLGRVRKMKVWPNQSSSTSPALEHEFSYYSAGGTESYVDPEGKVEKYLPDALGRLVERFRPGTHPIWNESRYVDSTSVANRTELHQKDGRGRLTRTVFDFAGRSLFVMEPGAVTEPTAGSPHQPFARFMGYDAASRLTDVYAADGIHIKLDRDGAGRILMRSRLPNALSSNLVSLAYGRDELRWNALGQMTEMSCRTGIGVGGVGDEYVHEVFDRDALGRLHEERFHYTGTANPVEIESYYPTGDSIRSELRYKNNLSFASSDLWMQYSTDPVGKLGGIQWKAAAAAGWTPLATYKHEGSAIRSRQTMWGLGQASPPAPGGFTTSYAYDEYGRMERIDQSFSVNAFVEFEYDKASNLVKEHYNKQAAGKVGDRFTYDEHNRLFKAFMGSDAANMASTTPDSSGAVVQKLTYNLDAANNRSSVISQAGLAAPSVTESYATQTVAQGPSNRYATVAGVQMHYDGRGNTHFDGRFYYVYDALDRLTEVYRLVRTSDDEAQSAGLVAAPAIEESEEFIVSDVGALAQARGSILSRVVGTPQGIVFRADDPSFVPLLKEAVSPTVVSSASPSATAEVGFRLKLIAVYLHDAMNRRVVRIIVDGPVYYYAWDGWQEAQELAIGSDDSAVVARPRLQSVWGEQLDELVSYRTSPDGGVNWTNYTIAEGGAHCPTRVVGPSGQVVEVQEYDPYGRTMHFSAGGAALQASAVGNPWGWKAVRIDPETSLLQMRHRYYSPIWGRFLSGDPLGVWGDVGGFGNHYGYGASNPLTNSDPSGLQVAFADGSIGGMVSGHSVMMDPIMGGARVDGEFVSSRWMPPSPTADSAITAAGMGSVGAMWESHYAMEDYRASVRAKHELMAALAMESAMAFAMGGVGRLVATLAKPCLPLIRAPALGLALRLPLVSVPRVPTAVALRWGVGGLDDLARFRGELGLAQGNGTLARLDVGGRSFYGINAHGQPVSLRVNAITRQHAEADAFQQAANAGMTGGRGTLYVDRALCDACGPNGGVRSMVRQLGLEELRVITPKGTAVIRP